MIITSQENEKIKELSKLQQKKYRDLTNTYLVEGEHLVEEAKKANVLLEVFSKEELPGTTQVSTEVMKKLSSLDTPPSMIGLCKKKENNEIIGNKIVILDEIQDPGNLGTIIRSSLAFNIDTIILSNNCVDVGGRRIMKNKEKEKDSFV